MLRAAARPLLTSHVCASLTTQAARREAFKACTVVGVPVAWCWQPTRGLKKRPLSSLELKIKADVVEKTKYDINKATEPTPEHILTNLEKPNIAPEQAVSILRLAIKHNIDTEDVYSAILDKLQQSGSPIPIFQVYETMFPNIRSKKYSSVVLSKLIACLLEIKSEKVFPLLDEMLQVELKPHHKQFGLIVKLHAEAQKWDQCFEFLDYMVAHKIKPDFFTFSNMFHMFGRSAPLQDVVNLKERMSKEGIHISKNIFWHMQEAYARYGMREKVVEMYQAARREIVHPYITMIHQYGKWGEPDNALRVLEEMKDDLHTTGLTPGVTTYNALFQAFCENKAYTKVYDLIDTIKKDKSKVNEETWTTILESALKDNETDILIGILARMKKMFGKYKLNKDLERRITLYFKEKDIDFVAEVNKQMWLIWKDYKRWDR